MHGVAWVYLQAADDDRSAGSTSIPQRRREGNNSFSFTDSAIDILLMERAVASACDLATAPGVVLTATSGMGGRGEYHAARAAERRRPGAHSRLPADPRTLHRLGERRKKS